MTLTHCYLSLPLVLESTVEEPAILASSGIFDELAVHPNDHLRISMSHDLRNPERIFAATQRDGCEAVPGLFHFSMYQTSLSQSRGPNTITKIIQINLSSSGGTEKVMATEPVVDGFLCA